MKFFFIFLPFDLAKVFFNPFFGNNFFKSPATTNTALLGYNFLLNALKSSKWQCQDVPWNQ
jgi:hypothetical protein